MLVAVEHLLAEGEERLCRNDVVLEHDDLVGQREGPLMRTEAGGVAALVMVEIAAVYLTLPVDMLVADNLTTGLDACHVPFVTRTVLIEKQF